MALAHPDELRWSTKPPTEPGYYWIAEEGEVPHVVQINVVSDSTNMFEVLLPGDEMQYSIEMWAGALWCGPLQHPE